MEIPQWISPALFGAGTGALALAILGFTWGGWITESRAQRMTDDAVLSAVALSLVPYCVDRAARDPRSAEIMADMKNARAFQHSDIVTEAGWATPLGQGGPNRELALACGKALTAAVPRLNDSAGVPSP